MPARRPALPAVPARRHALLAAPGRRPALPAVPGPRPALLALACAVALAACTSPAADEPAGVERATSSAAPGTPSRSEEPGFPVTLDNCGVEVTVAAEPQRIVAIKSSMIELALALGAGDRVVGTGYPDGPAPQPWTDEAAALPVLSDRVPSAETVLAAEPDLVMAGWESNLTGEGAGDRGTLAGLGVATYVAPSACTDPAHRPARLTFDDVFAHVEEAGTLLGATDAAERLVEEQRSALADLTPDERGLTTLWWSSGTDIPFVGAGAGAPAMIMESVGLENTAGDVDETWTSWSWEQVAADDPDVLVLVDSVWNSAEKKQELLTAHPVLRELTAVREGRFLVVPFPATEAGVRNVPAALDLAAQLAALDL